MNLITSHARGLIWKIYLACGYTEANPTPKCCHGDLVDVKPWSCRLKRGAERCFNAELKAAVLVVLSWPVTPFTYYEIVVSPSLRLGGSIEGSIHLLQPLMSGGEKLWRTQRELTTENNQHNTISNTQQPADKRLTVKSGGYGWQMGWRGGRGGGNISLFSFSECARYCTNPEGEAFVTHVLF